MKDRAPDDDLRRAAGHRGRYRLIRPVGANRFASLWDGEDAATDERVLVEVIRSAPPSEPDDAKLLRDRMAMTQDLPLHPGLLAVRSIHAPEPPGRLAVATRAAARARARRGIEEQQWLLVLDPFDGSTLDHRAAFGRLSAAAVCAIAAKVGEALGALHAIGIAHGSVSSTSVLVSDAGEVRLIDAVVGSWWDDRDAADAGARDRRAHDVAALARLVTDQLSPVAVPIPVRRLLEPGGEPTLDELVAALREAGSSVTFATAADDAPAAPELADQEADARHPEHERPPPVVIVPEAREPDHPGDAHVRASSVEEPERHGAAAGSVARSADRPGATLTTASATDPDLVVHLPEPPPVSRVSSLDWASPVPTATPALPSGEAEDRSAIPETEPTRWMRIAAVFASLVMFGAIGAAVYLLLRGG
jgi:serine/threonine protein kinase